jgi:hypothetical protein
MQTTKSLTVLSSVLALVLVAATHRGAQAKGTAESWQVEVDVFSSRPNPVFTVTGADLLRAKSLLRSAPVQDANTRLTTIWPNRLGYQGLKVRGGIEAELCGGRILRKGLVARALIDDRTTQLETFLISVGVAKGAISAQLEQLIRRPGS